MSRSRDRRAPSPSGTAYGRLPPSAVYNGNVAAGGALFLSLRREGECSLSCHFVSSRSCPAGAAVPFLVVGQVLAAAGDEARGI
ncbi:hypothetical protein E2C01_007127 [Portunus trituberculatus]|uniref:Uncharacterized protein n=1 Tax=Portunus trituberculatus TaxID=210409 RepID=A0A5B7D041_PORTR|nr:hypothetical protein [Portunus trituberculatus]